jgi:hypothetical protein
LVEPAEVRPNMETSCQLFTTNPTALRAAAKNGYEDVVELLLANKRVNPSAENGNEGKLTLTLSGGAYVE